jgi:hypothetical protein
MARSRPLAMCAVMFALGGCASDPDFLSERTVQHANAIDAPPAPVKAKTVSYREDIRAPAPPVALPSWKVVAAVKPGAASNAPLSPTNLFERVSRSVYGVKVVQEAGSRLRPHTGRLSLSHKEKRSRTATSLVRQLITLSNATALFQLKSVPQIGGRTVVI